MWDLSLARTESFILKGDLKTCGLPPRTIILILEWKAEAAPSCHIWHILVVYYDYDFVFWTTGVINNLIQI